MNERTLSDDFRFDITVPVEIGDAVEGKFLDYPFRFLVEETTLKDLVQSVKGMYNQDEMLYTWFQMPYGEDNDDNTNDKYPKASAALNEIAGDLGLTPNVQIDDFTPSNLTKGAFVTYADVLNNLFSWTSRVPQRQINVFIRGGTLHCIQRGKEEKTFDISNIAHSRPSVNKKFNRVLCHNPNNDSDSDIDDDPAPFSGSVSYSKEGVAPFNARIFVRLTYINGLLMSEQMSMQTGMFESDGDNLIRSQSTHTSYGYTTFYQNSGDPEYYLISKESRTYQTEQNLTQKSIEHTDTSENTSYSYEITAKGDELYLFHEHTGTTTETYSNESTEHEVEKTTKDVYHFPLGNGFYAQTAYINGIVQGANISQGTPGNRVSQFTVEQIRKNFYSADIKSSDPDFTDQLQAIVDDSFPVRENDFIVQLNEDLRWLHRKTVETVTVDLISKVVNGIPELQHIVDFTETVTLDNATYFLVSNNISFTPRKLIQKLQLIRWY